MRRDFNPDSPDDDWIGNNAAFRCDACKRIYIVSGHLHRRGRPCPFCGETIAYAKKGRRHKDGSAWIETNQFARKPSRLPK